MRRARCSPTNSSPIWAWISTESSCSAVIDVSGNGEWLLLGVYDLSRVCDSGYIRLRIPCSPADLTADRDVTLDDAIAYAARFSDGNALADLTDDGVLDLADIAAFLSLYADGCPG